MPESPRKRKTRNCTSSSYPATENQSRNKVKKRANFAFPPSLMRTERWLAGWLWGGGWQIRAFRTIERGSKTLGTFLLYFLDDDDACMRKGACCWFGARCLLFAATTETGKTAGRLGVLQCDWSTGLPSRRGGRKDVLECGWDGKGGLSCLVGVEVGIGKGGSDGCVECQLLLLLLICGYWCSRDSCACSA